MPAKGYTTEEKVEEYLNESISSGGVDNIILYIEKLIDNFTGRNFKADTSASYRYYNGDGSQELNIDDCVEVSEVNIGSNYYGDSFDEVGTTGVDRYYVLPNNYAAEGYPIDKLHLRSRFFTLGFQNQKIKAKWGYSTTPPDDIIYAATVLVASVYKAGRSGAIGGIKSERIGEYNVSFGADSEEEVKRAIGILNSYKKFEI